MLVEIEMEITEGIGVVLLRGREPSDGRIPGVGMPLQKTARTTASITIDKGLVIVDIKGGMQVKQKLSDLGAEVPASGRIMLGVSVGSTVKLYSIKVKPLK
jgi:hypothetical protein